MAANMNFTADFDELLDDCQKNNLVKAMLLMQKAISLGNQHIVTPQQTKLLLVSQFSECIIKTSELI